MEFSTLVLHPFSAKTSYPESSHWITRIACCGGSLHPPYLGCTCFLSVSLVSLSQFSLRIRTVSTSLLLLFVYFIGILPRHTPRGPIPLRHVPLCMYSLYPSLINWPPTLLPLHTHSRDLVFCSPPPSLFFFTAE